MSAYRARLANRRERSAKSFTSPILRICGALSAGVLVVVLERDKDPLFYTSPHWNGTSRPRWRILLGELTNRYAAARLERGSAADKSRGPGQLCIRFRTEHNDHHFCLTMKTIASLSLLLFTRAVLGHGGHEASGPAAGETIQQYAQRHVRPLFRRAEFWALNFHLDVFGAPHVRLVYCLSSMSMNLTSH